VQQQAILIVAQSGRFLAQIAAQAGYHPIWVADCFGDSDTLAITARWQAISDLKNSHAVLDSILALSRGQPCKLVYGGGVELFYDILNHLPNHIELVGNSPQTVETIRNPEQFFEVLDALAIAYPKTSLDPPQNMSGWICKSSHGLGGSHIQLNPNPVQSIGVYYQRHITGISGSALFLANGSHHQLLSINEQFSTNKADKPFLFSGLAAPAESLAYLEETLVEIINALMSHFELYGLNSLDFIVNKANTILVLEINPRPSASAELLTHIPDIFNAHLAACQGQLPNDDDVQGLPKPMYLHYIFALKPMFTHDNIIWPPYCHDLPPAGHLILEGEPICTAIVDSADTFIHSRERLEKEIHHLLVNA